MLLHTILVATHGLPYLSFFERRIGPKGAGVRHYRAARAAVTLPPMPLLLLLLVRHRRCCRCCCHCCGRQCLCRCCQCRCWARCQCSCDCHLLLHIADYPYCFPYTAGVNCLSTWLSHAAAAPFPLNRPDSKRKLLLLSDDHMKM